MNIHSIDTLHKDVYHILNHPFDDRIFGTYTDAYLQLMLDEVWGGDDGNRYLYVGEDSPRVVQQKFGQLLKEAGIAFHVDGVLTDLPVHKQSFLFAEVFDDGLDFLESNPNLKFDRIFANSKNAGRRPTLNILHNSLLDGGDII